MTWIAVATGSLACYALKLAGFVVPTRILDRPWVRGITALIPVALLAALTAVQAVGSDAGLAVDARLAGLGAAVIALLLRAPFIVVVGAAAAMAAALRALGWAA